MWCRVLDYREYKIFEDEEPNLKDSSSIDDGVIISGHLNPFHLFERLHNAEIFTVNGTKCRYVDIVILEGLQIENFYVLSIKPHQKHKKKYKLDILKRFHITAHLNMDVKKNSYKCREQVVVLVVIHLKLKDLL